MIIVRQQQAPPPQQPQTQQMLVVSAAANTPQQMHLLQQQNSIRLAASSSLGRGASPATAPSPRQPSPAGHFMSPPPRNPLHTPLSGTVLSQPNPVEQTMTLAQHPQQAGYGLSLDLTGLGTTTLGRADGDVTPLTPQDQLTRYVDQL